VRFSGPDSARDHACAGALLDGAGADIARRLDAYDANTDGRQEEEAQ
jgi:hypothetical protein